MSSETEGCPNCGGLVVYSGRGRRPVWCSTTCRNDAALKRRGARLAGVAVRVVEVRRPDRSEQVEPAGARPAAQPAPTLPPGPTPGQALRRVRNDPELVGSLLAHLERRRQDGTLESDPSWGTVCNALRALGRGLDDT